MKMQVVVLLICSLLVSNTYAASYSITTTLTTLCSVLGGNCDLSTVLALTSGLGLNVNAGSLTTDDTLTINANSAFAFQFSQAVNVGTIIVNSASGTTLTFAAGTTSALSGSLQVATGNAVTVAGTLVVASASTLNSAALVVSGSVTFNGGLMANNTDSSNAPSNEGITVNGNAVLTLAADSYFATNTNMRFLSNSTTNIKAGTTTVARSFTTNGQFVITSTLAMTASYTFTQYGNNLILSGTGAAQVSGNVVITNGATLMGQGTITSNLDVIDSTIAVGSSPGTVFVKGDLNMDSGSRVDFEASGDNNYDKLVVTGNARVDGNVICHLLNDYTPNDGTRFNYITTATGSCSGSFFSTLGDTFSTLAKWRSNVGSSTVSFTYGSFAATTTVSLFVLSCVVLFSLV